MRLSIWKRILLTMLLPVPIVIAVTVYAFWHIENIHQRVTFIKIADDINLSVSKLRRYEENILLFKEEENIINFNAYFEQIDNKIRGIKDEILTEINRANYTSLLEDIRMYKEASDSLISSVRSEHRLLEEIRPLGRIIENKALNKKMSLELRRHEKNYIIYREQNAVDKVHQITKGLMSEQLSLTFDVSGYLEAFNSLVKTENLKEESINKMQHYAGDMERHLTEFYKKEREEIERTIFTSKRLFIFSFTFLIIIAGTSVYLISRNMVRHLKRLEESLDKLGRGDFNHNIGSANTAEEISSLVKTYNASVDKLRESKAELDHTLKKLEDTNKELVERQDELVEARKLSAMRLLASEIAHEINNPLSSLITFLGMYHEEEPDSEKKETFALMLKETNRCQAILQELVDFARKEPMQLKEINPARLINEALEVTKKQHAEKNITLISNLEGLPGRAVLDPILIYQAVVNILTNAYQHSPQGGDIAVQGYTENGDMIIVIRDKGTGIAGEDLPYIFEPFFSKRKDLGGNGLGLAITRKIIERHHGNIYVESRLGEETVFKINLPVNQGQ